MKHRAARVGDGRKSEVVGAPGRGRGTTKQGWRPHLLALEVRGEAAKELREDDDAKAAGTQSKKKYRRAGKQSCARSDRQNILGRRGLSN